MVEQLQTGAILMLVGMGVVYALLAALVGVVLAVSRLSRMLDTAAAPSPGTPRAAVAPVEDELVGVISAALRMHRRRKPGKKD